jgi:indole-3-acetate monooxygenase
LTDRAAQALLDANLFSMLVAGSNGGLEASRVEFIETVETIATADGSAGWCLSVCATTAFVVSKAARAEVKQEVFGDGPVALWTSLLPRAKSVSVEAGFRVSGRFGWGSGSSLAGWVVVAEGLPDRHGKQWFRSYIVPKSDVDCDLESWKPMGLEATASIDYAISDKFVPTHRSFEYPFVQPETPGVFSTQLAAFLNQVGLTAFATGVGERALSELVAAAPKIRRVLGEGTPAEDSVVQYGIGEREGRLRAAPRALSEPARRPGSAYRRAWRAEPHDLVGFAASRADPDPRRARHDGVRFRFRRDQCRDEKRPTPTLPERHFCRIEARGVHPGYPRPHWQGAAGARRADSAA